MKDENYYRTLMHLRKGESGAIELWGGPTWTFGVCVAPEEGYDRIGFFEGLFRYKHHKGYTWKAETLFAGIPVMRFEIAFGYLIVILADGGRILIADHIDRLLAEAASLGMPAAQIEQPAPDVSLATAEMTQLQRISRLIAQNRSK